MPGIVLEASYLPVTRNMEIGGDWYDAFRLPDGKLAVAAGDVMGKGLTAAAGMGRVRNALRALALTDPRPAAVLSGLDRLFVATELEEQVTTVAYLVVDPETGDGLAGNAGHLPPLLLSGGRPAAAGHHRSGHPARLGQPAAAVCFPAAAWQHCGAVLRWTCGEPRARPRHRPGRAGGGGRAGAGRTWSRIRSGCSTTWSSGCSPATSRTTT